MRLFATLLLAALALPAAAQPFLGLVPGAPTSSGQPYGIVAVDAATAAQTPLGSVRVATTSYPDEPAPVFVDVVGQRAFFVRLFTGATGGSLVTADLATGAETERAVQRPYAMLFGYDATRDRLLDLSIVIDTVGVQPLALRIRGVLVLRHPVTDDTVHVATVARAESVGEAYSGDVIESLAAPAVAAGGRLLTTTEQDGQFALTTVDLATGAAAVHDAVDGTASVAAFDAASGDVYRTGHVFVATSDSTWRQRTVLLRDRLDSAAAPDTLATLAHNTRLADGTWTFTGLAGLGDVAVFDAAMDRVLLRVNDRLRIVDLATGAVTDGAPVGTVRFVGRSLLRPVATEATPPAGLALTASPNPARGEVRLALAGAASARVEAYSVLGRRVAVLLDGPVPAGVLAWDTAALPAGVYVVHATTERATVATRVTVVR